ncbi:MAG: sugar transferase [Alphaproteobacteria bacterium]|nr:sugar transferase [Alphaproteobacteria bacterium]MBU1516836.1 sugar transferase [Alphaproteobacteria bacterium]MBU2092530.1 sugar transferase [Alphaproteobacteria bacterium]MBU2151358.1 sugar transferase [Alphaproteobacteria bacterium]MBU2309661.1 sugar transferase [Alphaproteobacteria bacterium]
MTDVVARTVSSAPSAEEPAVRVLSASEPADLAHSFGKRAVDIAGALFAILLFLPLLVCIALAVRLESGGPVIFKQRRTGHCGRIFTIYKFRTMTVAEDCVNVRQATRDDVRVTAIGGVLRKLSLDELPQVLNVLKGDMSLVGPRPHALAHDDYYGELIPAYIDRFRGKPGLTGLAQVNGLRGEIQDLRCMRDRIAADNLYIDSWSLGLDIAILAKTALIIFRDPQAY